MLTAWGMDAKAVSEKLGVASAIKMCRSVMIKGLEALVIESYTTARAYGVEDHLLPTLAETFPSIDWQKTGAYFFSRVVQHGQRRAEEMRESANAVREAGFEPTMTAAIAGKQQWMADQASAGVFNGLAMDARAGRTTPTNCWRPECRNTLSRSLRRVGDVLSPGRSQTAATACSRVSCACLARRAPFAQTVAAAAHSRGAAAP